MRLIIVLASLIWAFSSLGGCGGGGDGDADVDVDADVDADADADGDTDGDGDHEADVDGEIDGDADRGRDADPDGDAPDADSVEDPLREAYAACEGIPFYPVGCLATECIDVGLERRVFQVWEDRFMALHGLTRAEMEARIVLSDVSVTEGPIYVWWRVDYLFVQGWARSRQNEVVNLGSFPLAGDPTDTELERAVDLAIEEGEQFDLPAVAPLDDVVAAFESCASDIAIDWCHLDFVNVSGELIVRGSASLDLTQCMNASVDVAMAELVWCREEPCVIP